MTLKLTLAAAAALLTACGGGGGGGGKEPTPPTQAAVDMVPSSATQSVAAYVQYVGSLPVSDAAEPLRLDNVKTAPTSDTTEPQAL